MRGQRQLCCTRCLKNNCARRRWTTITILTHGTESFAEALSYFPEPDIFHVGPESYLEHIRKAKAQLDVPIIASLNGSTIGGWTAYAKQIEQAGADALELNLYSVPTAFEQSSAEVEQADLEIVRAITS